MNFLKLEPLTADLLPDVVELDRRCLGGLWSIEGYRREIESPNSDLLILKQDAAPQPFLMGLGCLWAIAEEAHITLLGIDPAYRQQGLGQAILYSLLVAAHHRGLEWATLEVRVTNAAALQLYERFGFREVGRRKRYYSDGEDALILWCSGLQKPEFRLWIQDCNQQVQERLSRSGYQIALEVVPQTAFI